MSIKRQSMPISAGALLESKAHSSHADIDAARAGNICRCGTRSRIREAINRAAGQAGAKA
jgi:isoquinoline 1-oxidoreductase subunit alpha